MTETELSAELEECQAQRKAAFRRIEELDGELDALRKDAERYRFLRKNSFIWSDFSYISGVDPTCVGLEFRWYPSKNKKPSREDMDAAIDASMKGDQ